MSNLPKEIHDSTAVGGIVFEQTTFRDWCTSHGLERAEEHIPEPGTPIKQDLARTPNVC